MSWRKWGKTSANFTEVDRVGYSFQYICQSLAKSCKNNFEACWLREIQTLAHLFSFIFYFNYRLRYARRGLASPVPELSFLPALYRGWTQAGEKRVQENLHTHAQNAANFSYTNNNFCIHIKTCQLISNQWNVTSATLNHIRFVSYQNFKDNERNLCQDLLTVENTDSDFKVHAPHYANEQKQFENVYISPIKIKYKT